MNHEHLRVDISPAALAHVEAAVEQYLSSGELSGSVGIEVRNFANECRARLQHASAGDPDTSEDPALPSKRPKVAVPGRSADEDWLS